MPRPNTALPNRLPPLHLYRNILRECSYLPPAWRSPIYVTIRDHFRKNREDDPREKKHRARAFQVLGQLRCANDGDRNIMEKFMRAAYGRTGIRRRMLMAKFVLARPKREETVEEDGPQDSDALEALLMEADYEELDAVAKPVDDVNESERPDDESDDTPYKRKFHHGYDKPKLLRLLSSQRANEAANPSLSLNTSIKRLDENTYVPETNIWGKPPVRDLVETKRGNWWRKQNEKMMPPLGRHEWEMLGRLSVGAQTLDTKWQVPRRRRLARPVLQEVPNMSLDWNWEKFVSNSVHIAEARKSLKRNRRTGQKDTGPYQAQTVQRRITPRWYRRAYTRLWQITPVMERDSMSQNANFTWGTGKSSLGRARKSQLELFEGVDARGRVLPDNASNSS
ncbi:hypothetical protein B0J13DRAFT_37085 [Dactylonectria estremocensis]|uniref:LYR motif-containing protein Cup1-like N-terminal domain-containing protein n=1 Tax=Dactylonectria estremocensis TaxID=1079267 RepID=A0A9P9FIT0_9HYPO|nr:hypothetical protein B0J13DRAFT_37085 [Dactylonectria estremocensis]